MIKPLDDRTFVSGQIRPADIPSIKSSGVTLIVCNRPDGEEPGQPTAAEIEEAASAEGIEFRHVPIIRGIGPSDAEEMQEAMEAGGGKMLAYCRTGNRSTLVWAVARRGQGASVEELQRAATGAGYDLSPIEHLL